MFYGIAAGATWAVETIILGIALSMAPVYLDRAGDLPRAVCEHLHPRRVFRALGGTV